MTIEEKRAKLKELCQRSSCNSCPLLHESCGYGNAVHQMSDEKTNMLYSIAFPDADNGTNNGIDAKDEHLAMVAEIIAKECDKAVANYKAALLKKIFPYDAVDKKQYSINAYAVWQAINETEVHHD